MEDNLKRAESVTETVDKNGNKMIEIVGENGEKVYYTVVQKQPEENTIEAKISTSKSKKYFGKIAKTFKDIPQILSEKRRKYVDEKTNESIEDFKSLLPQEMELKLIELKGKFDKEKNKAIESLRRKANKLSTQSQELQNMIQDPKNTDSKRKLREQLDDVTREYYSVTTEMEKIMKTNENNLEDIKDEKIINLYREMREKRDILNVIKISENGINPVVEEKFGTPIMKQETTNLNVKPITFVPAEQLEQTTEQPEVSQELQEIPVEQLEQTTEQPEVSQELQEIPNVQPELVNESQEELVKKAKTEEEIKIDEILSKIGLTPIESTQEEFTTVQPTDIKNNNNFADLDDAMKLFQAALKVEKEENKIEELDSSIQSFPPKISKPIYVDYLETEASKEMLDEQRESISEAVNIVMETLFNSIKKPAEYYKEQFAGFEHQYNQVVSRNDELSLQLENSEATNKGLEETIKNDYTPNTVVENIKEQYSLEIENKQTALQNREQELSNSRQENKDLTEQLSTSRSMNEELTQNLANVTHDKQNLEQELSSSRQENKDLTEQLSTSKNINEELTQNLTNAKQDNSNLKEELQTRNEQIDVLNKRIAEEYVPKSEYEKQLEIVAQFRKQFNELQNSLKVLATQFTTYTGAGLDQPEEEKGPRVM